MTLTNTERTFAAALDAIPTDQRNQLISALEQMASEACQNPTPTRISGVTIERVTDVCSQADEIFALLRLIDLKCDELHPSEDQLQEIYDLIRAVFRLSSFHKETLQGIAEDM